MTATCIFKRLPVRYDTVKLENEREEKHTMNSQNLPQIVDRPDYHSPKVSALGSMQAFVLGGAAGGGDADGDFDNTANPSAG